MESDRLRIGDVASEAGVSARSLRYYEEQGLLHPERTAAGQRTYGDDAVERVRLLQRLYSAGLTSTKIAELLPCVDTPSEAATAASVAVMQREHERLSTQIEDLMTARDQLGEILTAARAYLHRRSGGA